MALMVSTCAQNYLSVVGATSKCVWYWLTDE